MDKTASVWWVKGRTAALTVTSAGLPPLALTLAMREDGLRVDRLLLITDTACLPGERGVTQALVGRQGGDHLFVDGTGKGKQVPSILGGGFPVWQQPQLTGVPRPDVDSVQPIQHVRIGVDIHV